MIEAKRLAVIKNRALGDAVISLSTLSYLKDILPRTQIYFFTPSWTAPLFRDAKIAADRVLGIDMRSVGGWVAAYKELRRLQVDSIFEMSQAGRTRKYFSAYSYLHNVPYVAHNHHLKQGPVHDQGVQKAIIQRDLDGAWTYFGKDLSLPLPKHLDYPPRFGVRRQTLKKRVIFGVVATRSEKMYPLEKYAEMAELFKREDKHLQIVAPLSRAPADLQIKKRLGDLTDLIEPIHKSLAELPQYFADSLLYVGNDTGIKHVAVAADIPTVTLFGPEPPLEWHPYDLKKHIYFYDPNFSGVMKYEPMEVHKKALKLI